MFFSSILLKKINNALSNLKLSFIQPTKIKHKSRVKIKVQLKNPQRIFYVDDLDTALAIIRKIVNRFGTDKLNVLITYIIFQKLRMDCLGQVDWWIWSTRRLVP